MERTYNARIDKRIFKIGVSGEQLLVQERGVGEVAV